MADYNLVCVNCFHRSHEDKPCPYCPQPTKENPNARCQQFVRADLFIARSIARIEEATSASHGQIMMALSTMFDLFCEVWPEASDRLQEKLKQRQAEAEARMKEEQDRRLAEAAAAYENATKAATEDLTNDLANKYTDPTYNPAEDLAEPTNNVLKFPVKDQPNDDPNSNGPAIV